MKVSRSASRKPDDSVEEKIYHEEISITQSGTKKEVTLLYSIDHLKGRRDFTITLSRQDVIKILDTAIQEGIL